MVKLFAPYVRMQRKTSCTVFFIVPKLKKFGNYVLICFIHPQLQAFKDWLNRLSALDNDDLSNLNKVVILCCQMWNDSLIWLVVQGRMLHLARISRMQNWNRSPTSRKMLPTLSHGKLLQKVSTISILMVRWSEIQLQWFYHYKHWFVIAVLLGIKKS